jgi:hypothetical protein
VKCGLIYLVDLVLRRSDMAGALIHRHRMDRTLVGAVVASPAPAPVEPTQRAPVHSRLGAVGPRVECEAPNASAASIQKAGPSSQ